MNRISRDTFLGLVFFGALGLLMFATASLSNVSLGTRDQLTAHFANAAGLRVGDPVFVLGHRNGRVRAVTWQPDAPRDRRIQVVLELDHSLRLREGAEISIRDATFLGGKEVSIDPGFGDALRGDPVTETRRGPLDVLGESLGNADLGATVTSIRRFFDKLNDPSGSIGALISERGVYDELLATVKSVAKSVEQIEKGSGPLHRLVYSDEMGQQFADTVRELREVAGKVNEGSGLVATLLNDTELRDDVRGIAADLKEVSGQLRAGEGLAGRLLNDATLAAKLDETMTSIRSVAAKLDDPGAGLAGALLGDAGLRDDARKIVADLAEITGKIKEGDGMLARLVNDETMGAQLERLLRQVSRAVEDAREAAPVGTFFSVLSGAF